MTLDEVADLIASPEAELLSAGNYRNRRGALGYFMQIKCGNHWCKVSVSHVERHPNCISIEELDEIVPTTSDPGIAIPVQSISNALKSPFGSNAPIHPYINRAGIEGIWTEFRFGENWYMLSVSHIDIPTKVSAVELEMLADEFLREQGSRHRRGRIRW